MRLFDSHSHINAREFDADRAEVITRMREAGLEGALVVACDYGEERIFSPFWTWRRGFCSEPGRCILSTKIAVNATWMKSSRFAGIRVFAPSEKPALTTTGARAT